MTRTNDVRRPRRGYPPPQLDDHPLLRVLIAEATRRGDTLAAMAGALGVTYERVAQWRRKEAKVSKASRGVLEAAAAYLDIPTAFVLCMVGTLGIQDLLPPGRGTFNAHVKLELSRLRMDPYLAGFVPNALFDADPAVQNFVVLLYREVAPTNGGNQPSYRWMRALHLAALGNVEAQAELANIHKK